MSVRKRDLLLITSLACSVLFSLHIIAQVNARRNYKSTPVLLLTAPKDGAESPALPEPASQIESTDENTEVVLRCELWGTLIGDHPMAFIYDPDTDKSGVYRLNELVNSFKLVAIQSGKVILERNNRQHEILLASNKNTSLGKGLNVVHDDSGAIVISKTQVMQQVLMARDLLSKVKIMPMPDAQTNKLAGLKIDNVPGGSIIEEVGIKNGDVICSVQGKKLQSLQDAWSMFGAVQNQNRIEVLLLRNNQPVTLNYEIKR